MLKHFPSILQNIMWHTLSYTHTYTLLLLTIIELMTNVAQLDDVCVSVSIRQFVCRC